MELQKGYPSNASSWSGTWQFGISLDKDRLVMDVGQTSQLVAKVSSEYAGENGLLWRSSNEYVATVDQNGMVTAIAEGNARITVNTTNGNNLSYQCNVVVNHYDGDYCCSCETCNGTGKIEKYETCSNCNGAGKIKKTQTVHTSCSNCNGTGKVTVYYNTPCSDCGGFGRFYIYSCSCGMKWQSKEYGRVCPNCGKSSTNRTWYRDCNTCNKTGTITTSQKVTCSICNGAGGWDSTQTYYETCTVCNGSGKVLISTNTCGQCQGKGKLLHLKTHVVEVPATCTESGNIDYWHCSRCNKNYTDVYCVNEYTDNEIYISPLGHDFGKWTQTLAPTCESKGAEERVCSRCGEKETREIAALGHNWNEPSYQWANDYSTCTATRTCKNGDHPETETVNATKKVIDPTCKEDGKIIYTATFQNPAFKEQTKTVKGEPTTGHNLDGSTVEENRVEPTCTEDGGYDLVLYCTKCGQEISRTHKTVSATGHTITKVEKTDPDCEHSGTAEHYTCCVCKKLFSDKEGKNEVTAESLVLAALGHKEAKAVNENEIKPTCTEDGGYDVVVYCEVCHKELSRKHESVPALGHKYGDWKYNGEEAKTHTRVCDNDPSHNETEPCQFDEGVVDGDTTTYTCKVCGGTYSVKEEGPDVPVYPTISDVIRIAGFNRFGTSQDIALMFKQNNNIDKLDAVILANGDNFADALAGSYLAAVKNAPIIITRSGKETEINQYISAFLKKGGTVYVLGGTAAVPESCLNGLTGKGYEIERIAGNNRYLTNLAILDKAGVSGDTLLIATGTNYADSLSASATGLPMLLVKDSLSDEQRSFLREHRGMKLIILGGTNAVNSIVESQLDSYGEVSRISGVNRAGTSLEIAKKFFPEATTAVIAYSHNFPDGLCGGPLANQINAPLILTRDNDANATASYLKSKGIKTGYVLGGTSVLSNSLVKKVYNMKSKDSIVEFSSQKIELRGSFDVGYDFEHG